MSCTKLAVTLVVLASLTAQPARSPQAAAKPPPARWLVTLELGPKWDASKPLPQQAGFVEHLAAVGKLATEGSLLVGGPLLESFETRTVKGAAWIVEAIDADVAKHLVAQDPFVRDELFKIASVRAFVAGAGAWLPADKPAPAPGK